MPSPDHVPRTRLRRALWSTAAAALFYAGFSLWPTPAGVTEDGAGTPVNVEVSKKVRELYQTSMSYKDKALSKWRKATIAYGDQPPQRCELHARGKSSARFPRKSLTVRHATPTAVLPGVSLRRVFLLNLAFDPHGIEMRFANLLFGELGLFPPHNQFVRLRTNGSDDGLYLLCERHVNALQRQNPDLACVLRMHRGGFSAVWGADGVQLNQIVSDLRATLAIEDPTRRGHAMQTRFMMESVVTWMACNSAMQNGDSVDEAFLYATRNGDGIGPLHIMGWDCDDLIEPPSHPESTLEDPLTWACESTLERAVLTTPSTRAQLRAALARVLAGPMSDEAVSARLDGLSQTLAVVDPRGQEQRAAAIRRFRACLVERRRTLLGHLRN